MVVKTNIDYQVVAVFLCENETISAITEVLLCIKKWIPTFQQKFCLTDYSNEEIKILESVFPEQARERWLSKTANGCCVVKGAVKLKLHNIAHATSEEICQNAVDALKDSEEWKSNPKLAEYLNSTWLCNLKRWVLLLVVLIFCFRDGYLLFNNNVYCEILILTMVLNDKTNSSLTAMLSICIEESLPHNYENYVDKNRRAHSSYRKYKNNIPTFLTNRPQPLVKNCMKMIDKVISMDLVRVSAITDRLYNVASFQVIVEKLTNAILVVQKICSCSAWLYSAYPCKHFFAIFIKENCGLILVPLLEIQHILCLAHCQMKIFF
ncbi:uncharacterized protein LOC136091067 [Hydra vulgaris]|uniref:Uncharacterized protein LOC136091067 n=1 Tax=Hydra vulgaris TaxID=6087 RepID=A0ABM4DI08_HYDVU